MTTTRVRTHPGEVLAEEFLKPLGISADALARAIRVTPNRITGIIAAQRPRAVTPDTALRLERYFGTTPEFWLNLQSAYDLSQARLQSARSLPPRSSRGRPEVASFPTR